MQPREINTHCIGANDRAEEIHNHHQPDDQSQQWQPSYVARGRQSIKPCYGKSHSQHNCESIKHPHMATTQLHHHIFDAVGAKSIFQKEQASQMSYSNRKMKVSPYTKQELFSFCNHHSPINDTNQQDYQMLHLNSSAPGPECHSYGTASSRHKWQDLSTQRICVYGTHLCLVRRQLYPHPLPT